MRVSLHFQVMLDPVSLDGIRATPIRSLTSAIYALTCIALWLRGLALAFLQVRIRFRRRAFERPEDARMLGVPPARTAPLVGLIGDTWRNELENTPAFLAVHPHMYFLAASHCYSVFSVPYSSQRGCATTFSRSARLSPIAQSLISWVSALQLRSHRY